MSRSATVGPLFLGEGRYEFRLGIGELEQLEEQRLRTLARFGLPTGEASLERVLLRLGDGQLILDEVRQVLRLGLVGAGMAKEEALSLVERHVVPPDLKAGASKAFLVLSAALYGVADDDEDDGKDGKDGKTPGESAGEGGKGSASPTDEPAGRPSTAKARKRATPRKKSAP